MSFESVRGASLSDSQSGGLIAIIGANGSPVVTYAADWTFEFPLMVGKSWTKPVRFTTHPNNRTVDYDVTCNVAEFAEVAVKAGRFNAFKVSCRNTIDTEEHFWYSPEMGFWIKLIQRRGPGNPAGVGTREVEILTQSIRP